MYQKETKLFELIIDTKCIGYSADFKYTYFQQLAKIAAGEIKTMYSYTHKNTGGSISSGPYTKVKPFVARNTNGELMTTTNL